MSVKRDSSCEIAKEVRAIIEVSDEEIENLKIESTHTIDIEKFVPRSEIDERYLDSPYYVIPEDKVGQEAFAVIRVGDFLRTPSGQKIRKMAVDAQKDANFAEEIDMLQDMVVFAQPGKGPLAVISRKSGMGCGWLCWFSLTSCRLRGRFLTATVSPALSNMLGMSHALPLTRMWPWLTSWRALYRDGAKPRR